MESFDPAGPNGPAGSMAGSAEGPATAQLNRPPLGPSRRGYLVASLIAVAALLIGGIGIIRSFGVVSDRVGAFHRVDVPGSEVLDFYEAGDYTLYYEAAGITGDAEATAALPPVRVLLEPADGGQPVTLEEYGGSLTYSAGGHDGRALATFHIDRPGSYKLSSDAEIMAGQAQLAVGEGLGSPLARVFLWGAVLLVAFLAALVLSVVTAVRRSRARRRLTSWS